jgi:xanthine dehydrogenase accessory factor
VTASTFSRAAELAGAGRSFVVATVVAVRKPTSARPGASGIIHPDGAIEGWVGGSCAQPVVVREALRALADGQPRLLRLSRDGPAEGRRADGVIELVMTCHSGGTLEIYVEPHLPAPLLWVVGTTPIAGALATLGAAAGWKVTVIDPIAEADAFPAARVHASADIRGLDPDASPSIVVASQGIWDEEAVGLALTREAAYVGLVASPTRAAVVRDWLREETTVGDERIAALRAPAGMDLGAETAEEVALSILAELVQVRRGRADFVASPGPATVAGGLPESISLEPVVDDIVLLDPVCGMTVERAHARHLAEHEGVVYAFCSIGCRTRFIKEPAVFLAAPGTAGMGASSSVSLPKGTAPD